MRTRIEFYYEFECPICRALYYHVLERLELEGLIMVDKIDVDSTRGSKKWRKWKKFCDIIGYEASPIVMMGPFIFMTWKTRDKPESITEAVFSTLELFEHHLREKIKELDKYPDIQYKSSFEQEALMSVNPDLEAFDEGVYSYPKGRL